MLFCCGRDGTASLDPDVPVIQKSCQLRFTFIC